MGLKSLKFWLLMLMCVGTLPSLATEGFNVNDVSFLFPLKQGRPYPAIPVVSSSQTLLDFTLLNEVLHFEKESTPMSELNYVGATFLKDPSAWFVTSFRYDDCGDLMAADPILDPVSKTEILKVYRVEKCQPFLRLVIQPFNSANQPIATAVHLLYKLDAEQNNFVVQELIKVKDSKLNSDYNKNGPLMVHPLLIEESRSNSRLIADKIQNLIITALTWKGQNPSIGLQVMTMTINTDVLAWKMVGGLVVDQHWKRFVTDFNEKFYSSENNQIALGVESIHCNFYEFCATLPQSSFQSILSDNILTPALKANSNGIPTAPLVNVESQTEAEIIDNPEKTHLFNTNCLSCHESANFRNRKQLLTTYPGPLDITPFTTRNLLGDRPSTIINFGYEGLSPQVSTRVAAESAFVARRLNLSLNLKSPIGNIQTVSEFWICLMSNNNFQNCINNENQK